MKAVAAALLAERLLWPVPRIRWEAARGLARLIRTGDDTARRILLDWIGRRELESEVILGLGVIDAFDLASAFRFEEVSSAIRAPSFLSDYLLTRNFKDAARLFPFRYSLSPAEPAPLSDEIAAWFERYWHAAVPPVFHHTLAELESRSGWPFLRQWKHDWAWLQATHPRPLPDRPYFFFDGDREGTAQLDLGQREIYVSAYLRTLAQAALQGPMPHAVAEGYALHALTLNPGLADLRPVPRPDWAVGSVRDLETHAEAEAGARDLWVAATRQLPWDQVPLHLTITRREDNAWLDVEMSLVIGSKGFSQVTGNPMILKEVPVGRDSGVFGEFFTGFTRPPDIPLDPPLILIQEIYPAWPGRFHSDILAGMTLASPWLFGPGVIDSDEDGVVLRQAAERLSTWRHWYSDWTPSQPKELRSPVNSLTGVAATALDAMIKGTGGETGVWVKVRHGARPQSYSDFEIRETTFWLPTPAT